LKLRDDQLDAPSLSVIGSEAARLLALAKYELLAGQFGYALSYDRQPAGALLDDVKRCLTDDGRLARLGGPAEADISVSYFKPGESNLVALVECLLPLSGDPGSVLLELIVTKSGTQHHVCIEDISYAPAASV
jgi:hypothetical protein